MEGEIKRDEEFSNLEVPKKENNQVSEESKPELDDDLMGEVEKDFTKPDFKYGKDKEDVEHNYEVRSEKLKEVIKELEEYTGYTISDIKTFIEHDDNISLGGNQESFDRIKIIVQTLDKKESEIERQRKQERESGLQKLATDI